MTATATAGKIDLRACKSSVTSQDGENGVIAAVFDAIGLTTRVCIEFGAYNLRTYSNVFPLWSQQGWHAVLIEGDAGRVAALEREYQLLKGSGGATGTAEVVAAFVTPQGPGSLDALVCPIMDRRGGGEPDLVSIDIDGMDYHVWKGVTRLRPRVVIVEHNPSIPAHMSVHGPAGLNAVGSSARALMELGREKGYTLVCCTMCNCIFVRDQDAHHFAHAGDLDALFDPSLVCYAISTFDGGVALSHRPPWGCNWFSRQPGAAQCDTPLWQPPRGLLANIALWLRARRKSVQRAARGLAGSMRSAAR